MTTRTTAGCLKLASSVFLALTSLLAAGRPAEAAMLLTDMVPAADVHPAVLITLIATSAVIVYLVMDTVVRLAELAYRLVRFLGSRLFDLVEKAFSSIIEIKTKNGRIIAIGAAAVVLAVGLMLGFVHGRSPSDALVSPARAEKSIKTVVMDQFTTANPTQNR